jgi:hypothetical protein
MRKESDIRRAGRMDESKHRRKWRFGCLILQHVRNWSYDTLEREVRANLVYRAFTRMGDEKVPDAKTLARLGQAIGPEVIREWHERLMELARERGVVSKPSRKWE